MERNASPILLRILSGPHQGAELPLASGDWIMGSDAHCDLVLADPEVATEHLLLRVGEEYEVLLRPLHDSPVYLDGVLLEGEGQTLPLYTVFSLGATHACIGSADSVWPDIALPSFIREGQDIPSGAEGGGAAAGGLAEGTPEEHEAAIVEDSAEAVEEPLSLETVAPPELNADAKTGQTGWWAALRRKKWAPFVLGGLLLMLISSGWMSFFSQNTPEEQRAELRRELDANGFAGLELEPMQGQLRIFGAVPLPVDRARLEQVIAPFQEDGPQPINLDITVLDVLLKEMRTDFDKAGAKLRVDRAGTSLRLSGYVYDEEQLNALLAPHAAGLAHAVLKSEPLYWAELQPELQAVARVRRIADVVRFVPTTTGGVLVQSAKLTPAQQVALSQLEAEVTDILNGTSPFEKTIPQRDAATTAPSGSTRLAVSPVARPAVQSLCQQVRFDVDGNGRFVLKLNNMTYREGGRLPEGYRISELTGTYAVLIRDGNNLLICHNVSQHEPGK